jgi:hypothetical protein
VSLARGLRRLCWAFGAWLLLVGCHGQKQSAASKKLPPLAAGGWLVPLETRGFGQALASVPLGASVPSPVLIAIHGDRDRPEWACGSYRSVIQRNAFILCPRGVARPDQHFTLGTSASTADELRQALPALKARFGAHVAAGSVVLAGLGPAVEHVIELALKEPSFFSHLLLVDGSTRRLTLPAATRFGAAGGRRVLALCSPGACDADIEERLRALGPTGVATRVVRARQGHGLDQEMVKILRGEFAWLVSGEPRWR